MSNDLPISYTVTRTELSLPDLELNTSGGTTYRVITDSMGPGSASWRRTTADSPWVPGEALIAAVRETTTMPLGVRVTQSSPSALRSSMVTLVNAFSQFEYEITIDLDGETWGDYEYCQPADFTIGDGGVIQNYQMISYRQEIYFEIPRNPITSSGVA